MKLEPLPNLPDVKGYPALDAALVSLGARGLPGGERFAIYSKLRVVRILTEGGVPAAEVRSTLDALFAGGSPGDPILAVPLPVVEDLAWQD